MNAPFSPRFSRRGVALVIVLAVIVLITALVVGFMERASSDRSSAASYSASTVTRRLADTAVNLVQGQINQATTSGTGSCWASQPGAIRVFDNSGGLAAIYRLYSAQSLAASGVHPADLAEDIPSSAWAEQGAVWVDLNAPAQVTGGTSQLAYPILDVRSPADPSVNIAKSTGLDVSGAPGATVTQPAPMPVRWLYTLQNGEIIAPDTTGTGDGKSVTFKESGIQPSKANPIVGRIAFWTDDETCKVNINTAGGDGSDNTAANTTDNTAIKTFWDTPHFMTVNNGYDEGLFGNNQPANHEYQRYPGHPATTSLKSLLNGLGFTGITADTLYGPQSSGTGSGITPRYANGGSLGATVGPLTATGPWQITPRSDRLYPSVSELLFHPDRTAQQSGTTASLTKQRVETANFFLTANSRAPELNLFGQPRISIWPVSATTGTNYRSAIDELLAFCSTVGGNPYYFTRQDNKSETTDISLDRNAKLLQYLDRLTQRSIPGFGGSFETKYPSSGGTSERRQILTEIFDYIRTVNLHDSTVAKPFAAAAPQLNTTVGEGQVVPSYHSDWKTQGFGRYYRINEVSLIFVALGTGPDTSGSGIKINTQNPTPWYYNKDDLEHSIGNDGSVPANCTAVRAFLVFSVFDPSMGFSWVFPDMYVNIDGLQNFSFRDSVTGTSFGFASAADMAPMPFCTTQWSRKFQDKDNGGSPLGGFESYRFLFAQRYLSRTTIMKEADGRRFPFFSSIVPIRNDSPTFQFSGGKITIYVCAPNSSGVYDPGIPSDLNKIVQTYEVEFPSALFPVPSLFDINSITPRDPDRKPTAEPWSITFPPLVGGTANVKSAYWSPSAPEDRWYNVTLQQSLISSSKGTNLLAEGDIMKSMALNKGDIRLLARKNVLSSAFRRMDSYDCSLLPPGLPIPSAYKIETGNALACGRILGTTRGKLAKDAAYHSGVQPVVPPQITQALTSNSAFGDWDNGISNAPDGPYINRADEGVKPNATFANPYQDTYFNQGLYDFQSGASLFSPNRQIPSAVMFGSLPTGVVHDLPWQTLLFQPGPGASGAISKHPGEAGMRGDGTSLDGAPPDHLLLDLFWMPVAEPYAISEPASTAGKVNLNYQIVPFSYISRTSAIRAVLASEKIAVVGSSEASRYKLANNVRYEGTVYATGSAGLSGNARVPIDIEETLKQFSEKFSQSGDQNIFRSASEICDIFLIPRGYTRENFPAKWYETGATAPFGLVGDNVRERPYAHIYPRVTTKSNTYTVHYTVQALKNTSSEPAEWHENKGRIIGEYRGATMLERYIDPNDPKLKKTENDFATSTDNTLSMERFYKWRIIRNEQFCP